MKVKGYRLAQAICLVITCILLWPPEFWAGAPKIVIQLSPFVAICNGITLRNLSLAAGIGLVFGAVGIFRKRWFCKYACPVRFLLDIAEKIGMNNLRWWRRCPSLGKYFAVLTFGGSLVGYPLLLWMDPLAVLSNSFAVRSAGGLIAGTLSILGLALLLALSVTSGPVWCARLCPLGGTLDLLASIKTRFIRKSHVAVDQSVDSSSNYLGYHSGRRSFVLAVSGIVVGLVARRLGSARGESAPLRPPGAAAEASFTGLCLRCGSCVRSCPEKIIQADIMQAGIAGFLAPVLSYNKSYCLADCAACTKVCPSGAIQQLELPAKQKYVIGEALLDGSLCVLALGQRDCDACVRSCPFDAVSIRWDAELYIAYPVVNYEKCNGCGACEVACPTFGDKAIRVWKKID